MMTIKNILSTVAVLAVVVASAQVTGPKAKNQKAWNKNNNTDVVYTLPENVQGPKYKNQKAGLQGVETFAVNTNNVNTMQGPQRKNEADGINYKQESTVVHTQTFAANTSK